MDVDTTAELAVEDDETPIEELDNFMSAEEEEDNDPAGSDDVGTAGLDEEKDEMESDRVEGTKGATHETDMEPLSSVGRSGGKGKKAKVGTDPPAEGCLGDRSARRPLALVSPSADPSKGRRWQRAKGGRMLICSRVL